MKDGSVYIPNRSINKPRDSPEFEVITFKGLDIDFKDGYIWLTGRCGASYAMTKENWDRLTRKIGEKIKENVNR